MMLPCLRINVLYLWEQYDWLYGAYIFEKNDVRAAVQLGKLANQYIII